MLLETSAEVMGRLSPTIVDHIGRVSEFARRYSAGMSDINPTTERLRYRLLTGQDTAEFCHRVSDALDDGYVLYGSPTLIFDPDQGTRVAAQAVILKD